MPRFAANLTMLFNEVAFLDRFAAAAETGFRGVEYLFPYAFAADDQTAALRDSGLTQVLHNLPAGDWEAGDRGIACLPHRQDEFRQGVEQGIGYARALGCTRLNCLAGIIPEGLEAAEAHATLVDNLRYAADALARAGIRLLIEPINTRDIPGFFLCHTRQALAIVAEVGASNLWLQYDAYHMQIMEGDLTTTLESNLGRIAHIQIADTPGRHEPGTGEIHYPFIFRRLDEMGYDGWIGCEYRPRGDTRDGLSWIKPWQ